MSFYLQVYLLATDEVQTALKQLYRFRWASATICDFTITMHSNLI